MDVLGMSKRRQFCVLFIVFSGLSFASSSCLCGRGLRPDTEWGGGGERKNASFYRIINGYQPSHRPWMAYLSIRIDSEDYVCGGSLLDDSWVLTAAHCFCARGKSKLCHTGGRFEGLNDKLTVDIILGVNDVKSMSFQETSSFQPERVMIHPDYTPRCNGSDIALIKLNRKVTSFSPGNIMPICIPSRVDPGETHGFVAGWGKTESSDCSTSHIGPSPFSKCAFPFKFKSFTFYNCANLPLPSNGNPFCKRLLGQKKMVNGKNRIVVRGKRVLTNCYEGIRPEFGWCATCDQGKLPGQPGYCSHLSQSANSSRDINVWSKNWGACGENCDISSRYSSVSKLREVELRILETKTCLKWTKAFQNFKPSSEFCAVGEKNVNVKDFRLRASRKNRYRMISMGKPKSIKIFGGSDSCTGDSGSPLWIWRKDRAYLLGIVSRGRGCALQNSPGIYTTVQKHLPWIKKHTNNLCIVN